MPTIGLGSTRRERQQIALFGNLLRPLFEIPELTMKKSQIPILLALLLPLTGRAATLAASDGAPKDTFGCSVSVSGGLGLVGAEVDDEKGSASGSAYVFRNLDTATGHLTQSLKLTASDGAANEFFGNSVSVSGSLGLVTAYNDAFYTGAAYIFRDLDTATGTITENAKLVASDGVASDRFGTSSSLSGSIALIGAPRGNSGAAYIFRNLDTATGTINENLKLIASDGAVGDYFGTSVSLNGGTGLVGAYLDDDKGTNSGSAYLFRNLDTATGTLNQSLKLNASDGAADDYFGFSVSHDGSLGLVGAYSDDDRGSASGSAYVFRDLDTASGSVTQSAKLTASDGAAGDNFGYFVSLSGSAGLVGAPFDNAKGGASGSAYLFINLDTASGSVTENVKLFASDGESADLFGVSVSLDGDNFIIGAQQSQYYAPGKAYTGSVSSVTKLDAGNASRTISGLSFISKDDWIIGQTTDYNSVTLSAGDTADVTASGKAVYIGQNAGSDYNMLAIDGILIATEVYIGSTAGNEGNTLQIDTSATFGAVTLRLAPENVFSLEGNYTNTAALFARLGPARLQVWDGDLNIWTNVTSQNAASLITLGFSDGYTAIQAIHAVPEPTTCALIALSLGALLLRRRNGNNTKR